MKSFGMDISGRDVRYIELAKNGERFALGKHGYETIPEIVGMGISAAEGLKLLRKEIGEASVRILSPYKKLISEAGFKISGDETEELAEARAVIPKGDKNTYLLIDLRPSHAMISIVSDGAPQFTSTAPMGDISFGIPNAFGFLSSEVDIHYAYWYRNGGNSHEKKIRKILVSGDTAGMEGVPEHMTRILRAPVERANVWVNVFDKNTVPEIDAKEALGFSRAIGLALGGYR